MNYRLIVLTHGDSATLAETLRSFEEFVTPSPTSAFMHVDGPSLNAPHTNAYTVTNRTSFPWEAVSRSPARGFCEATRRAWEAAAEGDHEFVFWLEHDFVFRRPVHLPRLASVLDRNPGLAQMALMRQPVNASEIAAGSVVLSRQGQFLQQGGSGGESQWMLHRSYWTTNPSLFRRDLAAAHPWPEGGSCEGRFGLTLADAGYSFGMWGSGEAWVEHVGERDGFGY